MNILKIFTDGGAKGNPGPAAIGIVFYIDGKIVFKHREDIGVATNNDAEYKAVITALEKVGANLNLPAGKAGSPVHKIKKIELYSDSSLMVNQLNGLFKVKNARIREYVFKIKGLEQEIGLPISYTHIPREKNQLADALVNNEYV
jgi:ribonuclease HI